MERGIALKRWQAEWHEARAGEARRRSIGPATLLSKVYALAFAPLYRVLDTGVVALASLPVILIAARHGRDVGLATALLAIPGVTILLNVCTPQRGAFVLVADGRGPGTLVLLLAVGVIGHLRDVQAALRAEVAARTASEGHLRHLAFHDPLTGLPNRALFARRLDRALGRDRERVAVLLVDLDDFKAINDRHGHAAGDALLVAVGARLVGAAGPAVTIAQLGGDELAVLLPASDLAGVRTTAAALLAACATPFAADGRDLRVTLSVGGALGTSGTSASELLRAADRALYRAKRAGKGRALLGDDGA